MKEKIVLMGTPNFAKNIFEGIINAGYNVGLIVSQPDKEVGRKRILTPTPVKELAASMNIEFFQPIRIKQDFTKIKEYQPDLIITCAYGQILPKELLDLPRLGCINIHASLLPKLRGGAPIHHAIIDGYEETGITIMKMVEKMDAGAIYYQKATPISDEDTLDILYDRLSNLGKDLILEFLPKFFKNDYIEVEQNNDEVTFGYNIKREEERINWNQPVRTVFNMIRGLNSTPGAYSKIDGKTVKIFDVRLGNNTIKAKSGSIISLDNAIEVQCNDGTLIIDSLQYEGKKRTSSSEFLRGNKKLLENKVFD